MNMDKPPTVSWEDVARKQDFKTTERVMSIQFDEINRRLDHLIRGIWALCVFELIGFLAVVVAIATKF
jgi:hypothetical protein